MYLLLTVPDWFAARRGGDIERLASGIVWRKEDALIPDERVAIGGELE
jgi:hypothetical protein